MSFKNGLGKAQDKSGKGSGGQVWERSGKGPGKVWEKSSKDLR